MEIHRWKLHALPISPPFQLIFVFAGELLQANKKIFNRNKDVLEILRCFGEWTAEIDVPSVVRNSPPEKLERCSNLVSRSSHFEAGLALLNYFNHLFKHFWPIEVSLKKGRCLFSSIMLTDSCVTMVELDRGFYMLLRKR